MATRLTCDFCGDVVDRFVQVEGIFVLHADAYVPQCTFHQAHGIRVGPLVSFSFEGKDMCGVCYKRKMKELQTAMYPVIKSWGATNDPQ